MIQGNTRNHRAQIPISLTYGCDKDNNTYTYRMIGGSKVFQRVQLGPGWQDQPFTPNCEILKGDGEMIEAPSKEELLVLWRKHDGKIDSIRKELQVNWNKAKHWLVEAGIINSLGTPIAQTEPGGDQPDPAQDEGQSAETIIQETKPTYTAPLTGDTKPLTFEGSHFNPETPLDPQRKTYTATQYDADVKAGTYPLTDEMLDEIEDDRRSALSHYCEQQAVESLRQGWVIDIFKHHQLSRGRKLELIGMLLDWEAGA